MGEGKVVGLFAGIGGLEHGLHDHGWQTEVFCEIDPAAQAVLQHRFPGVPVVPDVTKLRALPQGTDMVTAGFPCQDLSQAGRTGGIHGERSGLVEHVFRLVRRKKGPRWLLIENVPFMLRLDRGLAMRYLTSTLEELGYSWAYRVVDARAFGRPQRRWRVLLLASRTEDPREVLFAQDAAEPAVGHYDDWACGFYWTEGTRGLGWAVDAIPTLKGGSSIGIASPPAVRLPAGRGLVTPGIADAEWLQGFPRGWTQPALDVAGVRRGHRWKLVGNAVSALMSEWIGERLANPVRYDSSYDVPLLPGEPWPNAAWGHAGATHRTEQSMWPVVAEYHHLEESLLEPAPLSARATQGFLKRARASSLNFVPGFLEDVEKHLINTGGDPREVA